MVHQSDFYLVDKDGNNSEAAIQKFEQETIQYQWGTMTAVRRFCKTCGVLPFYRPRSNQNGYAITYPCVDWGEEPPPTEIKSFDGIHWERSHAETGISKETAKDTR